MIYVEPPNYYSYNKPQPGGNPRFYSNDDQKTVQVATPKDTTKAATHSPDAGRIK